MGEREREREGERGQTLNACVGFFLQARECLGYDPLYLYLISDGHKKVTTKSSPNDSGGAITNPY